MGNPGEAMPGEVSTAKSASYRNPNVKPDKYARTAKGTGEYSTDAYQVLTAALGPRYNEATKLRLYNGLVDKGVAQWGEPGGIPPTVNGQRLARMPVKVPVDGKQTERTLWVRPDLVQEVRSVLATDLGQQAPGWARALTQVQLAQLTDLVTHAKNILSVVTRAQGAGDIWKDVRRKMPVFGSVDAVRRILDVTREVIGDSPAIRSEVAELSKLGVLRQNFPATGVQKITHGQQFLHKVDTASRIVMNRFYSNLVERGLMPDTVQGRRDYINQIGQYNVRLMTPFMAAMRKYGLAPFIVAGRNYNVQGVRGLTGYAGAPAASKEAGQTLRAVNMLGTALLFTIPAMLNTLTTGKPGGRPGTPLGAWDLGTDEEDGKHKTFDVLQLTGLRRGMRLTGLDAMIEGQRQGLTFNMAGGKAFQDALQTALHPWMGPAIGFGVKAGFGVQPDIRGQFAPVRIKEGGLAQVVENTRAAIESQNPAIYSIAEPALRAAGIDKKPQDTGTLANIAKQTFLRPVMTAAGVKDVREPASAGIQLATKMVYGEAPEMRTAAEMERTKARKEYTAALRSGESVPAPDELSRRQRIDALKASRQSSDVAFAKSILNRLQAEDIGKVWPLLNEAEQRRFKSLLIGKLNRRMVNSRDKAEREQLRATRKQVIETNPQPTPVPAQPTPQAESKPRALTWEQFKAQPEGERERATA